MHRRERRQLDGHDITAVVPVLSVMCSCGFAALRAAAAKDHLGAHARQLASRLLTHAAVSSGDERHATGEIDVERPVAHRSPSPTLPTVVAAAWASADGVWRPTIAGASWMSSSSVSASTMNSAK